MLKVGMTLELTFEGQQSWVETVGQSKVQKFDDNRRG